MSISQPSTCTVYASPLSSMLYIRLTKISVLQNNFWVIKSNSSDVVNTVDPVVRDVVGVGAAGTTLR